VNHFIKIASAQKAQNASQLSTGRRFPSCCVIISNGTIRGIASEGLTPNLVVTTDALMTCGATTTGFHQIKTAAAAAAAATAE
jgi:hypothetical protein